MRMAEGVGRDVTIPIPSIPTNTNTPIPQNGIGIVTSLGEGVSVSFCYIEKNLLCSSERCSAYYL